VIDRYGLRRDLVRQERVEDIDYGIVTAVSDTDKVFTVSSNQGKTVHYARSVVLAVGPGNSPNIPSVGLDKGGEACCHAMQIREFPHSSVTAKMRQGSLSWPSSTEQRRCFI
jgi:cation diffusion facilitator CzcD-associated flavoprotein CzcO